MTKLMPGVRREDLAPAQDPGEGLRIAEEAARLVKDAYGDRPHQMVPFGSWVKGEAHEESDVDLVIVLDEIDSRLRRRWWPGAAQQTPTAVPVADGKPQPAGAS